METRVSSATKEVIIGGGRPTILIGERINPTGKKRLAQTLRDGSLEVVREYAVEQQHAGAHLLDVNVGAAGIDQAVLMPRVVAALAGLAIIVFFFVFLKRRKR